MAKVNEGDVFVCELEHGCGIEVKVTKVCGCDECDLVCCGKQMEKKEHGGGGCCAG